MAAATARGEAVALIDPLDMFDPPSAAAAGLESSRLLWIRGEPFGALRVGLSCEYATLQQNVDRAVKALNVVLQAGGFGLVVLDLGEVAPAALRRLPFTTWLRLSRTLEGRGTVCLLVGAAPIARSAGGVTVQLCRTSGEGAPARVMARVVRARALEHRDVCVSLSAAAC